MTLLGNETYFGRVTKCDSYLVEYFKNSSQSRHSLHCIVLLYIHHYIRIESSESFQ